MKALVYRLFRPALLLSLAGCYTYQPLASPEPEVGARVSVQLTEHGSRSLREQVGPGILHIEGDLLSADSMELHLSVRQVEDVRGISTNWNGERVDVPRHMVAGLQQRRFSAGGTVLLGGAVGAALYAVYRVLSNGFLGSGGGTGNPGAPQ